MQPDSVLSEFESLATSLGDGALMTAKELAEKWGKSITYVKKVLDWASKTGILTVGNKKQLRYDGVVTTVRGFAFKQAKKGRKTK